MWERVTSLYLGMSPRTRFVGAVVASCLGAGVAFDIAMRHAMDTRPEVSRLAGRLMPKGAFSSPFCSDGTPWQSLT
jgi:hypothetical protein